MGYVPQSDLRSSKIDTAIANRKIEIIEMVLYDERDVRNEELVKALHKSTRTHIEFKDEYQRLSTDILPESSVSFDRTIHEPVPYQGYVVSTEFNINTLRHIYTSEQFSTGEIEYLIHVYVKSIEDNIKLLMKVKLGDF